MKEIPVIFPYSFNEPSPNCVNVSPLVREIPFLRRSKIYRFEKKATTTTSIHFPEQLVRTQLKSRNLPLLLKS